jgi:hypothetical protein
VDNVSPETPFPKRASSKSDTRGRPPHARRRRPPRGGNGDAKEAHKVGAMSAASCAAAVHSAQSSALPLRSCGGAVAAPQARGADEAPSSGAAPNKLEQGATSIVSSAKNDAAQNTCICNFAGVTV